MSIAGRTAAEVVAEFVEFRIGHEVDGAQFVPADITLLTAIVRGASAERPVVDKMIEECLDSNLERPRLELLLQAILAAAAWELARNPDLPAAILVSEYVAVAGAFYGGAEPGLVNGILDRLARRLRPGELGARAESGLAEPAIHPRRLAVGGGHAQVDEAGKGPG